MQQGLRRILQAIGSEPRFGEHMAFDIGGNGLRLAVWCLGLVAIVQVIRPETLQRHVRPPGVVPVFELGTQGREVVESLDNRHGSEPVSSCKTVRPHLTGAIYTIRPFLLAN